MEGRLSLATLHLWRRKTGQPRHSRIGRGIELRDNGHLMLQTMVDVGLEGVWGTDFQFRSELHTAPVGSVEAEKMLEDGVAELAKALKEGIDALLVRLTGEEG